MDLSRGDTHTPIFNSLVAFLVPRLHEVDMMKTDRNRITIFGWFYKLQKQNTIAILQTKVTRRENRMRMIRRMM